MLLLAPACPLTNASVKAEAGPRQVCGLRVALVTIQCTFHHTWYSLQAGVEREIGDEGSWSAGPASEMARFSCPPRLSPAEAGLRPRLTCVSSRSSQQRMLDNVKCQQMTYTTRCGNAEDLYYTKSHSQSGDPTPD